MRNNETGSYYSEDEDREETNMMTAPIKCRKPAVESTSKKTTPQSCVIVVSVHTANGRRNHLALADTGSSATLANEAIVSECIADKKKSEVEWATQGGTFNTKRTALVKDLKLPQFTRNRTVEHKMHFFSKNKNDRYDFIFGRDFLQTIGVDILFSKRMLSWDGIKIDMFSRNELSKNLNHVEELRSLENKTILDANYEKPDLEVVAAEQVQLTGLQREAFLKFLRSKEAAFQGRRGDWNGEPVDFELNPGTKPFSMKPYMILHSLYKTTKKEVDRLEKEVGLLSRNEDSKYLSACFIIPKKDQTV